MGLSMLTYIRKIRHRVRRFGLKYKLVDLGGDVSYIGSEYGGFTVYGNAIGNDSIVYSFGIGEDISFDLGMIERYGCKVYAFDPTPKSLEWLEIFQLPGEFVYRGIGLSDIDGMLTFAKPENPSHVSLTSVLENYKETDHIQLPVSRLKTIMEELGHSHIDVLKMDIEGCEYGVINDIINTGVTVNQILVEFHHRFNGVGYNKTNEAIRTLHENGYLLFSISDNGEEMSFIRKDSVNMERLSID